MKALSFRAERGISQSKRASRLVHCVIHELVGDPSRSFGMTTRHLVFHPSSFILSLNDWTGNARFVRQAVRAKASEQNRVSRRDDLQHPASRSARSRKILPPRSVVQLLDRHYQHR